MVVVVLRESADWMQVAVVVTVRQALQDIAPRVTAPRMTALRSITIHDFDLRIFFFKFQLVKQNSYIAHPC